jgi:hypothetical protein
VSRLRVRRPSGPQWQPGRFRTAPAAIWRRPGPESGRDPAVSRPGTRESAGPHRLASAEEPDMTLASARYDTGVSKRGPMPVNQGRCRSTSAEEPDMTLASAIDGALNQHPHRIAVTSRRRFPSVMALLPRRHQAHRDRATARRIANRPPEPGRNTAETSAGAG